MKVINQSQDENVNNSGKKKVAVLLRNGKGGVEQRTRVYLVAVDELTGKEICMLMAIYPSRSKSRTYPMTKERLEEWGYDTSFTQWHRNGAMFIDPNGTFN